MPFNRKPFCFHPFSQTKNTEIQIFIRISYGKITTLKYLFSRLGTIVKR